MTGNAHRQERSNRPARRSWADLGPRLVSAAILVPVAVLALFLGGLLFSVVAGVAFAGAYREFDAMISGRKDAWPGPVLVGLLVVGAIACPIGGAGATIVIMVAGLLLAAAVRGQGMAWRLGGLFYLSIVILGALLIRGSGDAGFAASAFLVAVVWLTDSAAFFTGRQVGGAKMSPDISPSKTWSGALGGLAIGTAAGMVVWLLFTSSPWWIGVLLAVCVSLVGQLGDLAESAVKRRFRIKDSGDIIPGHGGLMDRLDSLALSALLMVIVGIVHGGLANVSGGIVQW